MKTRHLLASVLALFLVLSASTAMAQGNSQPPRNALRAGQSALSFGVPAGGNPYVSPAGTSGNSGLSGLGGLLLGSGSGTALGYHYMVTDRLRAGLNLGLTIQGTNTTNTQTNNTQSATAFGLDIAPQANYYWANNVGTVAPFLFGQVRLSTYSDGNDSTTGNVDNVDATTSFNSQEQTTLSVQAGLGVEWFPVTRFSVSGQVGLNLGLLNPTTVNQSGQQVDNKFGFNLFTSSLAANIYF